MSGSFTYKVLVVEDEYMIRENIVKKINTLKLNFEVIGQASNGQIALDFIQQNHPHIVLTDIKMPVMDGLLLAKKIYSVYPTIKIIIISGFSDFKFAQQAIRYGVHDFLLKPISEKDLLATLQKLQVILDHELKQIHVFSLCDSHSLSRKEIVEHIELYIRENFRSDISLGEIADKIGFTSDYLSRTFKKFKGESPIKFITKLRINEAKQLLLNNPQLDVKFVGEQVGYSDPYYFSRVFNSYTGLYPTEYRNTKIK